MRIDPAGWPFVGGALLLAVLAAAYAGPFFAGLFIALTSIFLFFFRDPERAITRGDLAVLSPADGQVIMAGTAGGQSLPPGPWKQISIFLSPMDVHVNRLPVGGRITKVEYHPGRFLPAYRPEAGDLNEYTEVSIDHRGQTVIVRQIVGILARRIVCRLEEGQTVQAGDRFGVMKFGSRMDVFVPETATLKVKPGDRAIGGITVIAQLAPAAGEADGRQERASAA